MASSNVAMVMLGVALIAAGALGLFFIRTFIGAINLVGDILPINTSTQIGQNYQDYIEPSLLMYIRIASAVVEILGIGVLIRGLWGLLPNL